MYSLENFILLSPLSLLVSLVLLAGLDGLGLAILNRIGLAQLDEQINLRYQSVVLGAMLVAALLFPLALLGVTSLVLMRVIGGALIITGLVHLFFVARQINYFVALIKRIKDVGLLRLLALINMVGLFFLALGPITSADALDYHIGVAIAILNNSGMPNSPEWFNSRFAGNGEVLNALGLAVGAEQFGALLQWASLMAIISLFWIKSNKNKSTFYLSASKNTDLILLAVMSTPVLLFLTSSPKPQLWPIAMTTLAFAFIANPSIIEANKLVLRKRFALICFLCMSAALAKFNFQLTGALVGCFATYTMYRRRDLSAAFLISISLVVLIFLPAILWKIFTYECTFLEAIMSPLPGHFLGTEKLIAFAQNNPDFSSKLSFPLSILIPSDVRNFSVVLGTGWVIFFFALRKNQSLAAMFLIAVVTTALLVAAPPSARMYLEPYLWGFFLCKLCFDRGPVFIPVIIKWIIIIQGVVFMLACWFGVFMLTPGALSDDWRKKVMERNANGYELMRWVDNVLPSEAVLLNGHRSMALAPRLALDYSWTQYADPSLPEAMPYLQRIKEAGVTHILFLEAVKPTMALYDCFGILFAGPHQTFTATRNPFNRSLPFDAWIYTFDSERLPGCASQ